VWHPISDRLRSSKLLPSISHTSSILCVLLVAKHSFIKELKNGSGKKTKIFPVWKDQMYAKEI
jgi:hypothetical protein